MRAFLRVPKHGFLSLRLRLGLRLRLSLRACVA